MNPFFNHEKILSLLNGKVTQAELYQSSSASYPVEFKANRLNSAESNFSCGAGLRVITNGRIGFAMSNNPDRLESLVERALTSARFGEKAVFDMPADTRPAAVPRTFNRELLALNREEKIALGQQCIDGILKHHGKVNIDLEVETSESQVFLHNLNGLCLDVKKTCFDFGFNVLHVDNNGLVWIFDNNASCRMDNRVKDQVKKAVGLLDHAKKLVRTGNPGTVILEPRVVSTLVSSFLAGANGKTVYKGSSPLSGKIDKKIADARFSLVDEPLLDNKPGSTAFDGEGMPRKQNVIIDKGVLKMFIYDLQTAGLVKARSTGNANRGYGSQPSPGYTNLAVLPGHKSLDEMIKETRDGLWIHSVLGGGQSNMLAGDFSLNAHLAFRIENGEITGRVKDTMISGNVYDVFNKIVDIGKEIDDSGPRLYPPISFKGINVSG